MSLDAEDIRNEKVKVLRSMKQVRLLEGPLPNPGSSEAVRAWRALTSAHLDFVLRGGGRVPTKEHKVAAPERVGWPVQVALEDVVIGQYRSRGKLPGYLDDKTVPKGRSALNHTLSHPDSL